MKEYRVTVSHTITVEAEDEDEAADTAMEKLEDSSYVEPDFHVEKLRDIDPEPPCACTLAKAHREEAM